MSNQIVSFFKMRAVISCNSMHPLIIGISFSNQITLIGLASSKNYHRWPRLLQKSVISEVFVKGKLQGTETAIVHRIAPWIFPLAKHSQSPLTIYSSTGLLERRTRVLTIFRSAEVDVGSTNQNELLKLRKVILLAWILYYLEVLAKTLLNFF